MSAPVPLFGPLPGGAEMAVILLLMVLTFGVPILLVVGVVFGRRLLAGDDGSAEGGEGRAGEPGRPGADPERVGDLERRVADLERELERERERRRGRD